MVIPSTAQRNRQVTPADTLRSIIANGDGSTTFQIYAPEAKKVTLAGDFSGWNAEFTKGENGIWKARIKGLRAENGNHHCRIQACF